MSDSVKFELRLTNPNTRAPTAVSVASDLRRHDQETGRREANKYAEEALLRVLNIMRQSKDDNMVMKCAKMLMDRAWGQTKALTEEEKKGADAGSILDILASVSVTQTRIENEARGHAQALANKVDDDVIDVEGFLEQAASERP